MRYCAHCGRPRDAGHFRSCQGCGYTAFTSKDPRLANRGSKDPGSRAGKPKAGVSRAGVLELGPVPELEVVMSELRQRVQELCQRRNVTLNNIRVVGTMSQYGSSLVTRATDYDRQARAILWVAKKAELTKLVIQLEDLLATDRENMEVMYGVEAMEILYGKSPSN